MEQLLKKDYEVIYFTDVLDEYVMQVCVGSADRASLCRLFGTQQQYYPAASALFLPNSVNVVQQPPLQEENVCSFSGVQHVPDYEDKAFANASKEDLKMADKDEQEKKKDKVCVVQAVVLVPASHTFATCMWCSGTGSQGRGKRETRVA